MSEISVFDIIGPIMIGPSSSHTAGALRIAKIAGMLCKTKITKVVFDLYGSFAKTYRGHGTDRALVGGILGFDTWDYRVKDSFSIAKEQGIDFSFREMSGGDYHPNTVVIHLTEEDGKQSTLRGASVGGGEIEIQELDGCKVSFDGKNNIVLLRQYDRPGVIAGASKVLAEHGINISSMNAYYEDKGITASTVIVIDGDYEDVGISEIEKQPNIISARYIRVK